MKAAVKILAVKARYPKNRALSARLKIAIKELWLLDRLLRSDDVDARVLGNFRDALNRVRNAAWAAQRAAASKAENQVGDLATLLAVERVRAAYQLSRSIEEDLVTEGIEFQRGQLIELSGVITRLDKQLRKKLQAL